MKYSDSDLRHVWFSAFASAMALLPPLPGEASSRVLEARKRADQAVQALVGLTEHVASPEDGPPSDLIKRVRLIDDHITEALDLVEKVSGSAPAEGSLLRAWRLGHERQIHERESEELVRALTACQAQLSARIDLPDRDAERVARLLHDTCERMSKGLGYHGTVIGVEPWDEIPETSRKFFVAAVGDFLEAQAKPLAVPSESYEDLLTKQRNSLREELVSMQQLAQRNSDEILILRRRTSEAQVLWEHQQRTITTLRTALEQVRALSFSTALSSSPHDYIVAVHDLRGIAQRAVDSIADGPAHVTSSSAPLIECVAETIFRYEAGEPEEHEILAGAPMKLWKTNAPWDTDPNELAEHQRDDYRRMARAVLRLLYEDGGGQAVTPLRANDSAAKGREGRPYALAERTPAEKDLPCVWCGRPFHLGRWMRGELWVACSTHKHLVPEHAAEVARLRSPRRVPSPRPAEAPIDDTGDFWVSGTPNGVQQLRGGGAQFVYAWLRPAAMRTRYVPASRLDVLAGQNERLRKDNADWQTALNDEAEAHLLDRDQLKAAFALDTPWPLHSVLAKLLDAVDHLMKDHDCDHLGYEGVLGARDAGRRLLVAVEAASLVTTTSSVVSHDHNADATTRTAVKPVRTLDEQGRLRQALTAGGAVASSLGFAEEVSLIQLAFDPDDTRRADVVDLSRRLSVHLKEQQAFFDQQKEEVHHRCNCEWGWPPSTQDTAKKVVRLDTDVTLATMSQTMGVKATELLLKLLSMGAGKDVHIHSTLDADTAKSVANAFGWDVEDVGHNGAGSSVITPCVAHKTWLDQTLAAEREQHRQAVAFLEWTIARVDCGCVSADCRKHGAYDPDECDRMITLLGRLKQTKTDDLQAALAVMPTVPGSGTPFVINVNNNIDKNCPRCGAEYQNIGHPLRPGVIIQRLCDCRYQQVQIGPGSFAMVAAPLDDMGWGVWNIEQEEFIDEGPMSENDATILAEHFNMCSRRENGEKAWHYEVHARKVPVGVFKPYGVYCVPLMTGVGFPHWDSERFATLADAQQFAGSQSEDERRRWRYDARLRPGAKPTSLAAPPEAPTP